MKRALLFVYFATGVATSSLGAQGVTHIEFPEHQIDVHVDRPREPAHREPSMAADRPDHGSNAGSASVQRPDLYPALTQANNAYNNALANWQHAYQQHQQALRDLTQFKEKYLDANGEARREWERNTVMAVLRSLENKVQDTYYELSLAEKGRNEAHGRAGEEFRKASEQFARAEQWRADAAAREQAAREQAVRQSNRVNPMADRGR